MTSRSAFVPAVCCAGGLLAGYFLGANPAVGLADQPPPKSKPSELTGLTQAGRLGGDLWMTSAEYRACCVQTYRLAARRLEDLVASPNPPARPAVVMDLDETVFDNSAFQTALFKAGRGYKQELWDEYEEKFPQEVGLVPGAKAFIDRAGELGVTVVFISNRLEKLRPSTVEALKRLGLAAGDPGQGRLLLKADKSADNPTPSDKTARRDRARASYSVLLWFGDNLRDFAEAGFAAPKFGDDATVEQFRQAAAARNQAAADAEFHYGTDWFVLPNPSYGDWDKLAGPTPTALLTPTTIAFPPEPKK